MRIKNENARLLIFLTFMMNFGHSGRRSKIVELEIGYEFFLTLT